MFAQQEAQDHQRVVVRCQQGLSPKEELSCMRPGNPLLGLSQVRKLLAHSKECIVAICIH